ncbi:MAG: T9SS type A sorting domain-containing protein [Bacteroidales bacterium]|nr:T9SS type A sorting domain-containing protein [Bacteroidales bacterium]
MKRRNLLLSGIAFLVSSVLSLAQTEFVKQIIIAEGAGGYVYVSSYNPETGETTAFDTINTGYVQNVIVDGNTAFVAANDYVVKYNIDTYARVDEVNVGNVNKLAVWNNQLFIGRWLSCVDGVYLKVYNKNDLSELLYEITEVNDQTYGFAVANDTVYLAVFGGYGAPEGKIAVIDPASQSFERFIELGTDGEGIGNLLTDGYNVYFVNETYNWNGDTIGAVGIYEISTGEVFVDFYEENIGRGYAVNGTALFLQVNGNVGTYNLYSQDLINTNLISGPGGYDAISSVVFDKVNQKFYTATTDYFSYGSGFIYDIYGDMTGTFDVGIATDAMAIDYRIDTDISDLGIEKLSFGPNPVSEFLYFNEKEEVLEVYVTDVAGRKQNVKIVSGGVGVSEIKSGIYFLNISTAKGLKIARFVKI